MAKLLEFHHVKDDSKPVILSKPEEYDMASDWEDIHNQREHRDKQLEKWRWAGSVYNILQNAQADDRISQITLGWIRSYIDTGISQMSAGEPEFDYEALGPSDASRTLLWKHLVKGVMNRSNYFSHQNIVITDAHIFGPGVFEVYQQRPFRTIRVPLEDGTFKDEVIIDTRFNRQKVGVRAVSPFRCTRNPNVSDPNEVASCTKEEILSWNQFVQNYGRVLNVDGKPKYKHLDQIVRGSHVKITMYQDEIRDVLRIYALSYGTKQDGETDVPPEQLGIPIFDRPLKIHDVFNKKGELVRSLGLNIPGMCTLVWLPYADKLNSDYETHSLYGMGLPEHMEGLDTFMQTAFNMTIDNWRLDSTVLIDYKSRDGTMPDFDANTYYGGEFVDADINVQSLGQNKTLAFDQMYEVIQKQAIPGTGININQITGDTSKTAFEFAQRIEANNKRAELRIKEWEQGPLKRLGTLLLSAAVSELTVHELEKIREQDISKIEQDIKVGRATKDDFTFKNGKPVERKIRFFIDVPGIMESFDSKRKTRLLDVDSTDNTLVPDKENPGAIHKIPVTREYVYPDWYVDSGMLFDTKVDGKRMITNKKIRDVQAIQAVIQNFLLLLQVDPTLAERVDVSKIFEQILRLAEIDTDDVFKSEDVSETAEVLKLISLAKDLALSQPSNEANAQEPGAVPTGSIVSPIAEPEPAVGTV